MIHIQKRASILILAAGISLLLAATGWTVYQAWAKDAAAAQAQTSPIHPTFALLDSQGDNVLESGNPVSTMQTCGECHDTEFIASHSFHSSVGLDEMTSPGELPGGRPWDTSPGLFGKWNPLTYGYLTPPGDETLDLSTAAWIMQAGDRHAGGGPAVTSRDGTPLLELPPSATDPEASILDASTGQPIPWDWQESGVVEMNCFLCHTPQPDNDARIAALQDGEFGWANTATLLNSGIVEKSGETYAWNPQAFDAEGKLTEDFVAIQDPSNQNCGACHGLVHTDLDTPLVAAGCEDEQWRTQTTGQIISPQRLKDSGVNLADKAAIDRSWDIHAERGLQCTDCHYALNNPVFFQANEEDRPAHLEFDPRRLELGEYLKTPLHQFARGQSAQDSVALELKDSMRRCESCHNAASTHDWLPYSARHMAAVNCETCHVPQMYASAVQQVDWTVVQADGEPVISCRGLAGEDTGGADSSVSALVTGYTPALLPRQNLEGEATLAPYNMASSWYWVSGDPPRPVRQEDLRAAWLDGETYHTDVLSAFDQDGDGSLSSTELRIDTPEKEGLIAGRLQALGLENPRITGEVQPYSINHNVTNGEWAVRDCQTCHADDSRLSQPVLLASYTPGGVLPEFVADSNALAEGQITQSADGQLYYQPDTSAGGMYVLGLSSVNWIDLLGGLMFLGVLGAIGVHATLRLVNARRHPHATPETEPVYMYSFYERLWHWLQTFAIILLLFTGVIIHDPDTFGFFSFSGVVVVHNVLAALLVINAGLSLFYHLASGEIRQYIPRPRGFFDDAITQTMYYVRGIFKGEGHPFEKTPGKKLNPLQQVTYFGILNVLLPLQILTGIFMWGAARWPVISSALGGLPFLAPFHTLIAWTFASFIVAHVYLTTTGPEPLTGIKAMMMGWEDVETSLPSEEAPHPAQEVSEA